MQKERYIEPARRIIVARQPIFHKNTRRSVQKHDHTRNHTHPMRQDGFNILLKPKIRICARRRHYLKQRKAHPEDERIHSPLRRIPDIRRNGSTLNGSHGSGSVRDNGRGDYQPRPDVHRTPCKGITQNHMFRSYIQEGQKT